jgi:2-polyprenyl-3-methyl-5-hydroxy-6-metoxy-1,4-benzoquinol methylase
MFPPKGRDFAPALARVSPVGRMTIGLAGAMLSCVTKEWETGMRFQDKVALITAAGAGIGRATADTMAREGAIVIGVDTDQARLDAMVAAIAEAGGRAHAQCANALDPTQVDAVVAGTAAR